MAQIEEDNQNILPELFESYQASNQTARLTVNYPDRTGVFFFQNGDLIDAQLGDQSGANAINQALQMTEEDFRVDLDIKIPPRTVFEPLDEILTDVSRHQTVRRENGSVIPQADFSLAETHEQNQHAAFSDSKTQAHNESANLTLNGRATIMEATARQVEEIEMNIPVNVQTSQVISPPEIKHEDSTGEIYRVLAATGMVKSGVVIDEDGIAVEEIGQEDASLAQTAFMIAGLELLVAAQFDLGPCEGAVLEKAGDTRLVTKSGGLTCAFIPVSRAPVAKAFNETRLALEKLAGERA